MNLFGDLGNPRGIERSVRVKLADSLAHILGRAGRHLDVDERRVEAACWHIRAKKQDPSVFARYFDAVFAINENQCALASRLLEELVGRAVEPVSFAIVPYTRHGLQADYDRFPRLLFAEFSEGNPMASPSDSQSTASTWMLHDALEIVAHVDPGICDEIDAFFTRIYLSVANREVSARQFGGVTSLLVWGASFMNVEVYETRWDAVQFLVHEVTHSLLFGLGCDQPLVLNSPTETYTSPLRSDQRPMDGLFHATLVCARLAAFNRAWLDSGFMEPADRGRSEEAVTQNLRGFRDGLTVVNEHGQLSEHARELIGRSCRGLGVST